MKKITAIITLLVLTYSQLEAMEIYDKKDIEIDLDISLSTVYTYEFSMFPGLSSFNTPTAQIELTGEYTDNLTLVISKDFNDDSVEKAFISYSFFDTLKLKTGRFKVDFGREKTENTATDIESDASDNFTPGYSKGISLYGKDLLNLFNYDLAFTNDFKSSSDNDSGHHTITLMINHSFKIAENYKLTPTYNVLYNTDEIFSQGVSLDFHHKKDEGLSLLIEYLEQRYFNYYWNQSILISTSYRFDMLEPFIQCEYYDEYIGEEVDEDSFNTAIGLNIYTVKDYLKIHTYYSNRYGYSKTQTYEEDYVSQMDHIFSLGLELKL